MACSPKQSKNITNGTYISAIQEGVIKDKDGEKFIIDINEGDKIYYLIRHAEKDTVPVDNPKLTEIGI